MQKTFSYSALIGAGLTALPLICSSAVSYYAVTHEPVIAQFGLLEWAIATLVLTITCAFAITTPTLLAVLLGFFLSWRAMLPLLLLNMGAIWLINSLVRWFDNGRLLPLLTRQYPNVAPILERIKAEELKFIFFAKLSPALPFVIANVTFALSGAKTRNILLGGFLGMIPRTLVAVWTGAQAHEIKTLVEGGGSGVWSQVVVLILLIVSVAGLVSVLMKAIRPKQAV